MTFWFFLRQLVITEHNTLMLTIYSSNARTRTPWLCSNCAYKNTYKTQLCKFQMKLLGEFQCLKIKCADFHSLLLLNAVAVAVSFIHTFTPSKCFDFINVPKIDTISFKQMILFLYRCSTSVNVKKRFFPDFHVRKIPHRIYQNSNKYVMMIRRSMSKLNDDSFRCRFLLSSILLHCFLLFIWFANCAVWNSIDEVYLNKNQNRIAVNRSVDV